MHGPELTTIVSADYFRHHELFRALQLALGVWGGPDGWAAFLEDAQAPGHRSVLDSVEHLFVIFISLSHSLHLI